MNPKTERKCIKCGKHKESATNYKMMPCGKRYNRCNDCVSLSESKRNGEIIRKKPERKLQRTCFTCGVKKDVSFYLKMPSGRYNQNCNKCRENGRKHNAITSLKPKSVRKNKKDDGVVDRNINSFENVSNERMKALKALEKAKELEQIKKSKGLTYVKSGLRSFILK